MKTEHTFCIYAADGEHIMIDADKLDEKEGHIELYKWRGLDSPDAKELIRFATFYTDRLIGFEVVR